MGSGKSMSAASGVRRGRGWTAAVVLAVAAVGSVASSCAPPAPSSPPTPPTAALWFVGDSLATGTGYGMPFPRPFVDGMGAAGFTSGARTTILGNTQSVIDQYGAPRTILAMGGVNDLAINATTAQITAAMGAFEAAMAAQGATVVWVMEPAWSRASQFPPINDWIRTRSHWIDCLAYQGDHLLWDGDHPADYGPFAQCVADRLLQMGGLDLG